jgi:hypothetical protein
MKKFFYEENCCVCLRKGDKVNEITGRGRENGTVTKIELVPNSGKDPRIVALLKVEWNDGTTTVASSDNFGVIKTEKYREMYPSLM